MQEISPALPRPQLRSAPLSDSYVSHSSAAEEMRTSPQHIDIHSQLIELAAILQRRFADLLLFCVTTAALVVLFLLTPTFGIVGWLYVLQH